MAETTKRPSLANGRFDADCAVVGAGPAGLAAALALGAKGAEVLVAGPPPQANQQSRPDTRTAAIFGGGITLLKALGAWQACAPHAAPLEAIRIIDDTGRLLRAPETMFCASEIGVDAFGFNIPNKVLVAALHEALACRANVRFVETAAVTRIDLTDAGARLALAEGTSISARLIAGADGRRSMAREAAGIAPLCWDYDQAAIACSFAHSRPHQNISNEFHRPAGPFTTVPMPGNMSSLVWVETKAAAARLMALDEQAFTQLVDTRLAGILGTISEVGPRTQFPLAGMAARDLAKNRVALIGEAAHVVPPIGAQGLNLGLRDGAALADCVADALAERRDPGGDEVMSAYRKARRADVLGRLAGVDLLNRSLISPLLPAQAIRGAGLHVLNAVPPLRRLVMRQGIEPRGSLPSLMRP